MDFQSSSISPKQIGHRSTIHMSHEFCRKPLALVESDPEVPGHESFFFAIGSFTRFSLRGKAKERPKHRYKDSQVIQGLPAESQRHKRPARIHGGGGGWTSTSKLTDYACHIKKQSRKGHQQG